MRGGLSHYEFPPMWMRTNKLRNKLNGKKQDLPALKVERSLHKPSGPWYGLGQRHLAQSLGSGYPLFLQLCCPEHASERELMFVMVFR